MGIYQFWKKRLTCFPDLRLFSTRSFQAVYGSHVLPPCQQLSLFPQLRSLCFVQMAPACLFLVPLSKVLHRRSRKTTFGPDSYWETATIGGSECPSNDFRRLTKRRKQVEQVDPNFPLMSPWNLWTKLWHIEKSVCLLYFSILSILISILFPWPLLVCHSWLLSKIILGDCTLHPLLHPFPLAFFIPWVTEQEDPRWISSLWIHSLAMHVRFPAPISFFGPGKNNLDMSAGNTLLIFCLFVISQKDFLSDAFWMQSFTFGPEWFRILSSHYSFDMVYFESSSTLYVEPGKQDYWQPRKRTVLIPLFSLQQDVSDALYSKSLSSVNGVPNDSSN